MMRPRVLAATVLLLAARAGAQPVFNGDPIDPSSGLPYVIQPGAPLFAPGNDQKYGTGDDILQIGTIGDVDLVVRSVAFAGAIPATAASVATAPVVIAGGTPTGIGTDAVFQLATSDGATPPAAGNPLTGPELNGRGALVLAYADLDGDGVIGPTAADGNADNELERQEAIAPIGRQVALLGNGGALGDIAVSLGAPASVGGLGVVLAAVALTGPSPPLYLDGAPLLTRLPLLLPADVTRITGKNPPPPNPNYLVSVEITPEVGRWFIPAPGDPVLGEPFAIPLDGSSVSNDLLQARSGAAVAAALAVPIGPGFVADVTRRVLPAVGSGGSRLPVERIDALSLADDGPGNGVTLMLFPADRLGNPADPALPATTVVLHGGVGLAIISPDSDGDPLQETIRFTSAEAVTVTIDDTGGSGDSGAITDLVATVDGAPSAAVRITIGTGTGGGPAALTAADVKLNIGGGGRDRLRLRAATGATTLDPAASAVRLTLSAGAQTLYDRLLPAGSLVAGGKRFSFKDAGGGVARLKLVVVRRGDGAYALRAAVSKLTLPAGAAASPVTLTLTVGARVFTATLVCDVNNTGSATRCH
ncbi:MAG TPA: hypothetical protein VL049_02305 [Candidatus Dormibacteraeota bacterium]|nr:hypothetical protein [Candidatus Dormibacteraeota bacterium]